MTFLVESLCNYEICFLSAILMMLAISQHYTGELNFEEEGKDILHNNMSMPI